MKTNGKIFKVIREDEDDIRISISTRYDKFQVDFDPENDFNHSMFSQLDIDEMVKQQCFNPGTILSDINTGQKFTVEGNFDSIQSKNGKIVKNIQKVIPL